MKNTNDLIFKPNELIEVVSRPISILGLRAYNSILKRLQEENTDRIVISPSEILNEIGATNSYDELYQYLDELQKTQVKSIDKRGKTWGSFVLISEFKKLDEGIFVAVPPTIFNVLSKNNKKQEELYYTTLKLLEEKSFKCSYSIIFFEIFKKYEKIELPKYSLETLKDLTKTQDKYRVYADFKKRVLAPAIKEINNFNKELEYSFEEIYTGRKVTDIQFFKKFKPKSKIIDAEIMGEVTLSEKLLKAIKKAKKSIYLNKSYSDKAMKKLLSKYDETLIIRALEESSKYNQEIKSFSSLMTAKIEDIKNSSNKAIEEKIDKVTTTAPKRKKKEITEDNIADIFENEEKIEKLKELLSKQAKEQGKINDMSSSIIKACRTREDIEMVANNLKIELNLELF
ncbi:MAG: replication initiation protein [Candidatus Fusobacterium pullicola]|uniref:Replication initiation protein n=1 Tax=Candidatus Fusobacterium pullicola TaxID=2838601 RepID=A0A9E2L066_9FUSO|nr:replication initiation protein [Candidatus Fusobacterium pullicola]